MPEQIEEKWSLLEKQMRIDVFVVFLFVESIKLSWAAVEAEFFSCRHYVARLGHLLMEIATVERLTQYYLIDILKLTHGKGLVQQTKSQWLERDFPPKFL